MQSMVGFSIGSAEVERKLLEVSSRTERMEKCIVIVDVLVSACASE
jgi:hypothetical protein